MANCFCRQCPKEVHMYEYNQTPLRLSAYALKI